jgi:chemotaxis receptor (MCP) glutamine deamidase CheD
MILATDISKEVLEHAKLGIYEKNRVASVPPHLRRKYLLRSKTGKKDLVRVVPELRALIRFRRLNFMDRNFGLRELMDMVFCRNVIIYFDRPTQEQVLGRICSYLKPGGYLFTGHSETLNGMRLPLTPVSHTVYRHVENGDKKVHELPVVYLKPADLYVAHRPAVVRTVLGSCLAITMFHPKRGIAAICHAVLPEPDLQDAESMEPLNPFRYVRTVVPKMIAELLKYDISLDELEVKMFGGADVQTSVSDRGKKKPMGRLNIMMAKAMLKSNGLNVKMSDIGGITGRKIFFYTHTGEVFLKRLPSGTFPQEDT